MIEAARLAGAETPDKAVLNLAGGRPGRAIALQSLGAGALASSIEDALDRAKKVGPSPLLSIAFERGGPSGAERLDLLLEAGQNWLRRQAVKAESGDRYAAAWNELADLRGQSEGLGLDATHSLARAAQILYRAAS